MKPVAFLAPEIPALSATFVYNEIFALQDLGCKVIPISIHVPSTPAEDVRLESLTQYTDYLYKKGLVDFLRAAIRLCIDSPNCFFRSLSIVFRDSRQIGFTMRDRIGLFYRFLAACRVAKILQNSCCRHIHVHFSHVPTEIAMYASQLTGIPFSFTSHANDLFERGRLLKEKIARAQFAVTISEYNREFLIAQGGQPEKIHIVRCGVERKRFSPVPLKKTVQPYLIGALGRMVEKKGFDTLLQAASLLRTKGLDFHLTVAGNGPLESHLRNLALQHDINTMVSFPGSIANKDVPSWLHSLDLFVLPCQQDSNGDMDGIPVVLMEAMLSGIPVVSTRISGIPELIMNEKEGLLVSPQAPEELAWAMERLLCETNLRKNVYKYAIERVESQFDSTLNTGRLLALLLS